MTDKEKLKAIQAEAVRQDLKSWAIVSNILDILNDREPQHDVCYSEDDGGPTAVGPLGEKVY